jgi:hypothetical protein
MKREEEHYWEHDTAGFDDGFDELKDADEGHNQRIKCESDGEESECNYQRNL